MNSIDVLIVEDDVSTAEIHAHFVKNIPDFNPIGIASTLDTARTMIRIYKPKLILLDYNLPDGCGIDLVRNILVDDNETNPSVIFITSSCQMEIVKLAIQLGCFDFFIKPVSYERLADSFSRYLKFNSIINAYDNAAQFHIDRVFNIFHRYKLYKVLPKGINEITLEKVKDAFHENNEVSYTAETLSYRVGISKTTARRYLEYCLENGFLSAKVFHGNIGRPQNIYIKSCF